jgi:tetratricopeptide (TPR) repeat protein
VTILEDFALFAFALLAFFAYRSLYNLVPMLMAVGMSMTSTFLFWKLTRLFRSRDVSIHRIGLKRRGAVTPTGWIYAVVVSALVVLTLHSGFIRYQVWRGNRMVVYANLATDPQEVRRHATRGVNHFRIADSFQHGGWGLLPTPETFDAARHLAGKTDDPATYEAWIRRVIDWAPSDPTLRAELARHVLLPRERYQEAEEELAAAIRLGGDRDWLLHHDRAAILTVLGRLDEAIRTMEKALELAPEGQRVQLRQKIATLHQESARLRRP